MAVMMEGNRTLAADDVDCCVSQIDCLSKWHVMNFHPVIQNCRHCLVTGQIGHQMEPYSLSFRWRSFRRNALLNKDSGKLL